MKHRIVAVSPQGKEYFGIFDESVGPQEEWQKVVEAFKSSDSASYKLNLESGDTLIVPNIKDWYIIIQKSGVVEDSSEDGFNGRCISCKFDYSSSKEEPCRSCYEKSNWQPK